MVEYKVINLVSGEGFITTDKNRWFENADQQQCVVPNLVQVKFKRTIYLIPVGRVIITYTSISNTKEKTYYRLTKDNSKSLSAYLVNKEETGAKDINLYSAR